MTPICHNTPLKTLAACLIICVALFWHFASAQAQENENSAEQSAEQSRQDYSMGTTHEGIVMEQDPVTGDRVIQVTPPPRDEEETQQSPTLLIQPEINIGTD